MSFQKAFALTGYGNALNCLERLLINQDTDWELLRDILQSLNEIPEDEPLLQERKASVLLEVQDHALQHVITLPPQHTSIHLMCEIIALAATIPLAVIAQNAPNGNNSYFRLESLCYSAIQTHVFNLLTPAQCKIASVVGLSALDNPKEISSLDVYNAVILFQSLREQFVKILPNLETQSEVISYLQNQADMDFRLLCHMILTNEESLVSNALLRLLPCILKRNHAVEELTQSLILTLWKILAHHANSSSEPQFQSPIVALIMLASYVFPETASDSRTSPLIQTVSYLDSKWLWDLLQRGLADPNGLTRKRCQYLLKRAVDWWGQYGVKYAYDPVCSTYLGDVKKWKLNGSSLWNDFFLLLETCEEKQVHLVKPVLSRLDTLLSATAPSTISATITTVQLSVGQEKETKSIFPSSQSDKDAASSRFHFSWLLVIWRRLMMHDNLQVTRWAIRKILTLDLSQCPYLFYPEVDFLFRHFVPSLNNIQIYYNPRDLSEESEADSPIHPLTSSPVGTSKGTTARLLSTFFQTLPAHLPTSYRDLFFHRLLHAVTQTSWNAVALCHVADAFTAFPAAPVWRAEHLQLLQRFLSRALQAHEPLFRASVQSFAITFACNLTTPTSLSDLETIEAFCLFVGSLKRSECLEKTYPQYQQWLNWFKLHTSREVLANMVKNWLARLQGQQDVNNESSKALTDTRPVSRTLVAWVDATKETDTLSLVEEWLKSVLSYVTDSAHRSYVDTERVNLALQLLRTLLEEMDGSPAAPSWRSWLFPYLKDGVAYITARLPELSSLNHYEDIEQYCEFLDTVGRNVPELGKTVSGDVLAAGKGLLLGTGSSVVNQVAGMALLAWWTRWARDGEAWQVLAAEVIKAGRLNHRLQRDSHDGNLSRDVQTRWGSMVSRYFGHLWTLLGPYASTGQTLTDKEVSQQMVDLVEAAVDALERVGTSKEAIAPIFSALGHLLPHVAMEHPSLAMAVVEKSWNLCLEFRRAEPFWHVAQGFVAMAMQLPLLRQAEYCEKIYEILAIMRDSGEAIVGFYNLGVERLVGLWLEAGEVPEGIQGVNFVADILTFGILRRRDESILYETSAYIAACADQLAANAHITSDHDADLRVRFRGVQMLLALSPDVESHVMWANQICRVLIQRDLTYAKHRFTFSNSYVHRVKQRIWQAVLLLHPFCSGETGSQVLERVLENLVSENPQPSVRFLQEWVITRLTRRHPHLLTRFWDAMQTAVQQRIGCVVSFIAIATHIVRTANEESEASRLLMDQCLQRVLPWTMAQHFTPRMYAMMSLKLLWTLCEERGYSELLERYELVKRLLELVPEQANFTRNLLKLNEDFYFRVFNHEAHYSLETLYWDLPRLSHVAPDEWIPPQWFDKDAHAHKRIVRLPLYNPNPDLRLCKPAEWVVKAAGAAGSSLDEPSDENGTDTGLTPNCGNVQKKVTPWKNMLPDLENLAMFQPAIAARKKEITDGLVVVASLIDRLPNLGGLCRTCEVFGVKEMVLASLKYAEDKQFTTLSVSAERWIPLKEVKVQGLLEYLECMKKEGYTVIGAEQTANSVSLSEYRFPKKSLLLLGSEKEGIPVELIQQLDVCVEVPQFGLIRSMNVHVTGAVFIWEYRRQQALAAP